MIKTIQFVELQGRRSTIDMPVLTADVRGEWAAHRNPNGAGWRVSHVPTGRSLATLADDLTHRDATRIVHLIARAVPVLRIQVTDPRADDGAVAHDEDRRIIEAIVAEVVGS